ncbi:Oidioi.mRNA.OKI2018_I69.PAR.g11649.t1.cds [Oikopleura dioica]|uniref:Oidioi.mRNA.OKI2018_I69.PAR.g11649.t1.cds n=1 Tax=Oikopleura dioica TaxID=34765 RepID=A0ABN7S3F2_OIKDI|nr:Oidioi.mRNA.OKI2018_I69.PAR.g11649.t1.cds [Oikopleura dioica]
MSSKSPWQPRVNVSDEQDALAKRCQSYSPIVSPWAIQSRLPSRSISTDFPQSSDKVFSFKSPASFCSSSSAGSTTADETDDLDSPFDDSGSTFMKEFQEAAAQLAELAKSAKIDEELNDKEDDCLEKLDCHSLGWVPVTKAKLREDAKKVLEASLDKVTGQTDGSVDGKPVRLGLYEENLRISMEGLTCLTIPRRNLKVWSVLADHLCIVYKNSISKDYECQIFSDEDSTRLLDFCDQLNAAINNLSLSKAVSMTSLVDEKSAENNFVIECAFCGYSAIDNSLKSDVREVHKIIYSLQNSADQVRATCTITPSSLEISRHNGLEVIQCRLRYVSFFALGVDPRFIGIVSILGPVASCYVLKIQPNACRVSSILQENIILRYQKAIEAKKIIDKNSARKDSAMLSKIVDLTPSRKSVNDMPVLSCPEKPISRWRSLLSLIKKS